MPRLHVVAAGPLALVQDSGRDLPAWGVARSGAADRAALALANRLVGNDPGAAGIECAVGGLVLRAEGPLVVAVTGADCPITSAGIARDSLQAIALADGEELALGTAATGLRAYVAVRGGIDAAPVLGSRARDVLALLGPEPLAPGMVLTVGAAAPREAWFEHVAPLPRTGPVDLEPGPRLDWFEPAVLARLTEQEWVVDGRSDRTGIRLRGEPLARRVGDLPSEPTRVGAVQVPPDGQPIILGPDAGVSGGYPVVAVVTDAHLDRLAQLRPGDTLRLRWA